MNKILLAKRIKVNGSDNEYIAPFLFDSKGYNHLDEPNINLSTRELVFKGDIVQNMKKALSERNMEYMGANFSSCVVKFKMNG